MRNSIKPAFLLLLSSAFLLSCGEKRESPSSSEEPSSSSSEATSVEKSSSEKSSNEEPKSEGSVSIENESSTPTKSEEPSSSDATPSSEEPSSSNEASSSEEPASSEDSSEETSTEEEATYYVVSFDSLGGSEVPSQRVKEGEKAVEPSAPKKEGYEFQGWYKSKTYASAFSFATPITTDYELFAKWGNSSETSEGDSSDSSEEIVTPHGPEGSSLVSWYLCGSGSLWGDDGWSISNGVQLFSNPNSSSDKGCILDLSFSKGDIFKVSDGTSWFGYEKVSQFEADNNKGRTNFAGVDDGYDGQNIQCEISGTYDIYVNSYGEFWIE